MAALNSLRGITFLETYVSHLRTHDPIDRAFHRPLPSIVANMVILCFENEGVNRVTTEWGFAWLNLHIVRDIAPGNKGEN